MFFSIGKPKRVTLHNHPQAQWVLLNASKGLLGPRITRVKSTEQRFFQYFTIKMVKGLAVTPLLTLESARDLLFKAPQPFGAVTGFYKEHLSLVDSHAIFKDSITERHPAAPNLNLSALQSFVRILNLPDTDSEEINHRHSGDGTHKKEIPFRDVCFVNSGGNGESDLIVVVVVVSVTVRAIEPVEVEVDVAAVGVIVVVIVVVVVVAVEVEAVVVVVSCNHGNSTSNSNSNCNNNSTSYSSSSGSSFGSNSNGHSGNILYKVEVIMAVVLAVIVVVIVLV